MDATGSSEARIYLPGRLPTQRQVSPRTMAAYRDTWRLLRRCASSATGKTPRHPDGSDWNATRIGDLLQGRERERHNAVRTRHARLATIPAFFKYAAYRHPELAAVIQQALAIPFTR